MSIHVAADFMHTYLRRISMPLAGEIKATLASPCARLLCGCSMPESPKLRFHICLPLHGEIVALCGEPDPKYIINAAHPFSCNSEFICAKCLKSYQKLGR